MPIGFNYIYLSFKSQVDNSENTESTVPISNSITNIG